MNKKRLVALMSVSTVFAVVLTTSGVAALGVNPNSSITIDTVNGKSAPFALDCSASSTVSIAGHGAGSAPPGLINQYAVEINWGDGSITSGLGTFTPASGHGSFTFTFVGGPHTYTSTTTHTITALLYHQMPPGRDNQSSVLITTTCAGQTNPPGTNAGHEISGTLSGRVASSTGSATTSSSSSGGTLTGIVVAQASGSLAGTVSSSSSGTLSGVVASSTGGTLSGIVATSSGGVLSGVVVLGSGGTLSGTVLSSSSNNQLTGEVIAPSGGGSGGSGGGGGSGGSSNGGSGNPNVGGIGGGSGEGGGGGVPGGSVLGASTVVPGMPSTGAGGESAQALLSLALAALTACAGLGLLRYRVR